MNKIIALIFSCIFNPIFVNAQQDSLKALVIKNIVTYHFRYALNYDLGLDMNRKLYTNRYFFEDLWPDNEKHLRIELVNSSIYYPKNNYSILHFYKKGFKIGTNEKELIIPLTSLSYDEDYLIAFDNNTKSLKFLSGNFFKNKISEDFNLNMEKPDSFIEYILINYFNYGLKGVNFLKKRKGLLLFSALTRDEKKVIIQIDSKDFDKTSLKHTQKYSLY